MARKYILKGKKPVPCDNVLKWGRWFETAKRKVALTKQGRVSVSTVFLGLNHNFGAGKPLLFETMVFGSPCDQDQERYSTWEEAEAGHARMCEKVFAKNGGVK